MARLEKKPLCRTPLRKSNSWFKQEPLQIRLNKAIINNNNLLVKRKNNILLG